MKRKLLATLLTLCMVIGLLPMTALAEDSSGTEAAAVAQIGDQEYTTLAEAINAVPTTGEETTITVLCDITDTSYAWINSGKNIILDLGTHTVTNSGICLQGARLTLKNGTISGVQNWIYGSNSKDVASDYSKLTIDNSATLIGSSYGLVLCGDQYADKEGYGVQVDIEGTLNGVIFISGNLGNNEDSYNAMKNAQNIVTVNVKTGGVIDGTYGRTLENAVEGIVQNGWSKVNVEEGATIKGTDAITVKRGILNITGGTLEAVGSKISPTEAEHSGAEISGAAITVSSTYNYAGTIEVIISGGTFRSANNAALYVGHSKESSSTSNPYVKGLTVDISNGIFVGGEGETAIYIADAVAEDAETYTKEVISGGSFSSSVAAYVVDGLNYEANTSDVYTYHTTLDEALATGGEVQSVSAAAGDETTIYYTVELVNGATTTTVTVSANEAIQLPTLASSGYSYFQGWQSGTALYQGGAEVEITADTTFTAQWLVISPVIPTPPQPSTPEETEEPDTDTDPTPEAWTNPYADVSTGDWYYDAVAYVSAEGIMTGTTTGSFAPNDTMTRAMVWTVLARMEGQNVEGGSPWYAMAQSWAMNVAVSDGTGPNDSISREQLVTMLYRQAGSPEVGVSELAKLGQFTDGEAVSDWAQSAMAWAVANGILTGEAGALNPQAGATRAQVAAILMRYCQQ